MTHKPRRPRADVVARRFKRGESVEEMANSMSTLWDRGDKWLTISYTSRLQLVEDALRRSMNRGGAWRRSTC